ncbi:hypothetical protein AVEN_40442-1 [Araneus ventricosus]|uniref:Uncharacterized protein n=1 Tax=Araneus ventricosus TaxID=182803 RepID=A0A4Y2SZE5_ARAVE|nr:hypothetical protein AVEN_40442-1 [Araneus ventricosus]
MIMLLLSCWLEAWQSPQIFEDCCSKRTDCDLRGLLEKVSVDFVWKSVTSLWFFGEPLFLGLADDRFVKLLPVCLEDLLGSGIMI